MNCSLSRLSLLAAVAVASMLSSPQVSSAERGWFTTAVSIYPNAERLSCGLCHNKYDGFASRNPYGLDFASASGNVSQKLMAIEGIDSDGDGTPNGLELMTGAGFMPGFTCDTLQDLRNAPADIADFVDPERRSSGR